MPFSAPSSASSPTLMPGRAPAWLAAAGRFWVAGAILLLFWALMIGSLGDKNVTMDELAHAVGGYTYWKFNDYRMNPENGNLPQRIAGIPLILRSMAFPPRDAESWRSSDEWTVGFNWFYRSGNDPDRLLFGGRAACGLLAVALGALVWWWSRRLFGPAGALLSLLLYVLNPTVLANGPLITSDMACALFFCASTFCLWSLLHRVTFARVIGGGLVLGGLFLSKMSAPLILPIGLILVAARLAKGRPLPMQVGRTIEMIGRGRQALVFAGVACVQAAIVFGAIWAAYGFRYSSFAGANPADHLNYTWEQLMHKPGPDVLLKQLELTDEQHARFQDALTPSNAASGEWSHAVLQAAMELRTRDLNPRQAAVFDRFMAEPPSANVGRLILALAHHELLPEAYLYGYAHAWSFARFRPAFMNGEFSLTGWKAFFPYTFLIKTPLAVFGFVALALGALFRAAVRRPFENGALGTIHHDLLYETAPLWSLAGVYGTALIFSHINIGHRHMLAIYPPLFILCGATVAWLPIRSDSVNRPTTRFAGLARPMVAALLGWLAIDTLGHYPNYLAYFNLIGGGTANGYRHLVDSSLDWGQDLKAVKRRIDSVVGPAYLAYFGNGSPAYYGVKARLFHGSPGWDEIEAPAFKTVTAPGSDILRTLQEELRRHPDYDPALIGSSRQGDNVRAVLVKKASALRLTGGTYFISATLLQTLEGSTNNCFGPWNQRYEGAYQELVGTLKPLLDDSENVRRGAMAERTPEAWQALWQMYDEFRFARLAAFLRHREPVETVNGSILVYRLSDQDLALALAGPPPELGLDVPQAIEREYGSVTP